MDRRKFLVGSAAVSAATVAAAATATNATALPRAKSSVLNEAAGAKSQWRLQYPLTKQEKADGTVVHDLTFPTNDPRRYEPSREVDQQAVMDAYYKAF